MEVQKESKQAPICQAEDIPEPTENEVPHFATLRRRPKGSELVTCYVIEGDNSNTLLVPQTDNTSVAKVTQQESLDKKTKSLEEKNQVKGSRAPPLTHLFSKPPTPTRRPPTRWLSAKKAFEERPIVLKVMERKDFSMLAHFTETPV